MRCKNCGAQNADTATQCENCGAFLKKETEVTPVAAGVSPPPKKKLNQTAITVSIVVGVIIVAIIATCVVLAVRHKQGADEPLTSTSENAVPSSERTTKQNNATRTTKAPQTEPPQTQPSQTEPTTQEETTKETVQSTTTTTLAPTQQEEKPEAPENQPNE